MGQTENWAYSNYTYAPKDYNDTWLSGAVSWTAADVEVYYTDNMVKDVKKAIGCYGSCSKYGFDEIGSCSCNENCIEKYEVRCCNDYDYFKCTGSTISSSTQISTNDSGRTDTLTKQTLGNSTKISTITSNQGSGSNSSSSTVTSKSTTTSISTKTPKIPHYDSTSEAYNSRPIFFAPTKQPNNLRPNKSKSMVPVYIGVVIGVIIIVAIAVFLWKGFGYRNINSHSKMNRAGRYEEIKNDGVQLMEIDNSEA